MNRKLYYALIGGLWMALPITAHYFRENWDRLPARIATHFNAAHQPNGWMSREQALWSSLEMLTILLIVFTVVLVLSHRKRAITTSSWALLAFFYVAVGLGCYIFISTIDYNLAGEPIRPGLVGVVFGASILTLIAIYVGSQRGTAFPAGEVIAQEVHAVRGWAILFLPLIAIEFAVIVSAPNAGMRFGLTLVCLVLALAVAMVWNGFHYYFTRHGLEIRTLGFRLKSIPATQIQQYSSRNWNPIGGYGIRGLGNRRAYVWGNKGVCIKTRDGEVFLGHAEPEKIIRDLDSMMKFTNS
ncbi:MAG: hypothetical protein DMG68_02590 [Acidobacteria bacterium]|jgi:hypothetical protein|nr:MAG: hypothetical protein DMG68_02590 [Acidobacteriota bacterium]